VLETAPIILVIDDKPEDRALFRRYLSQNGDQVYELVEEASGSQGVATALRLNPACILLADSLPDMGGLEFLAELQRQGEIIRWPVIMVIGAGSEAVAGQALRQGAQDYLVKGDISPETLRRVVKYAIERAAMVRQLAQQGQALESHLAALRESEWQQRLLVELSETIRRIEEPDELLFAVVQTIGEHLQVRRCLFVEIDTGLDWAMIRREYCRGVPPVPSEYRVSDYSAEARAEMETGLTVVNHDAQSDPRTAAIYEKTYQPYGERAYVAVPLLREGRWVSVLWVSTDTPREWEPAEIALLETVAERAWLAIENARLKTATQAALGQVRENEQMLALAMRGGRMGAWWRDLDTNQVWWSPELEALFGVEPNGFSGTEMGFYEFVHPDDRPVIARQVEQAVREHKDYLVEFRFHHTDGSMRWMEGRGRAVYSAEGQPLRLYGIGIDITERKQAEEALRQVHQELEQRVAERTAELEQSLQELNEFTYIASHDLKAPLRAVKNLANWVVSDAADRLPEASKIHLAKMQNRIERMDRFLDDLLTYSRVGRDYYQRVERVDTVALIKEIIETLALSPGFAISIQTDLPVLKSQRLLLEIVFKNLIDNAIKHHHRADGQVQIRARELDHFIEFSVTDDGPGIDPMFHHRIFQIFQTLRPRDMIEGTGAGLAIVKKAVESQGGTIQVISAEGEGATFRFTWPKA
jgi:PAS domain S-box-containing protein